MKSLNLDMTCSMMVVYQQVGMYKMMEASTYEASVYSVIASLGMVSDLGCLQSLPWVRASSV